ncbi:MAG TPA: archaeal heat shock protein Hsp20 [Candidatus Bathyarchaeia archaeon]|nr:archaeal heat shock protein Hsp20 [Candidatus Bathyarchaeia archaeon]
MFWEDDFPELRRLRRRFMGDRFFDDMDKMMEEMFKEAFSEMPEDMIRERKLPCGGTIKEMGPFVYGYSITMEPDGKPIVREFGNVKPSLRAGPRGVPKLEVKEEREPLVDVIVNDDVKVVAELPGVDKKDIKLDASDRALTITVNTEDHKYYKKIDLPTDIDPDSSKASYKNGVLEVTLAKRQKKEGKGIRVD